MLSLCQLAISALNEFELCRVIDCYNEICRAVLYAEIYIPQSTNNIIKKSLHGEENQTNWEQSTHYSNETEFFDLSLSETMDIMREMVHTCDFLLQRIEETNVELIGGHKIFSLRQLAGEIVTFLSKFNKSYSEGQCTTSQQQGPKNESMSQNKINESIRSSQTDTAASDLSPTENFTSNQHNICHNDANPIEPNDGCQIGPDHCQLDGREAGNIPPPTFMSSHPPYLCGTLGGDQFRSGPMVGPRRMDSGPQSNKPVKIIFAVTGPIDNLIKHFNVNHFNILHFEVRERNWKKRRRKQ